MYLAGAFANVVANASELNIKCNRDAQNGIFLDGAGMEYNIARVQCKASIETNFPHMYYRYHTFQWHSYSLIFLFLLAVISID